MTFGTRLRKHREKKRFSQREVAELIGVSQTTVYNWEADITSCRVKFLSKLVQALKIDMAELVPEKLNKQVASLELNKTAPTEVYSELLHSKDEIIRLLKEENTMLKNRNTQLEEKRREEKRREEKRREEKRREEKSNI